MKNVCILGRASSVATDSHDGNKLAESERCAIDEQPSRAKFFLHHITEYINIYIACRNNRQLTMTIIGSLLANTFPFFSPHIHTCSLQSSSSFINNSFPFNFVNFPQLTCVCVCALNFFHKHGMPDYNTGWFN